MRNGFTNQHQARHGWFLVPTLSMSVGLTAPSRESVCKTAVTPWTVGGESTLHRINYSSVLYFACMSMGVCQILE
ncbi:mCG1041720 [Mus musculus]|nr:mCG1041720 [Mus musculus]